MVPITYYNNRKKMSFVFITCVLTNFTTYCYWTLPVVQTSLFHNFINNQLKFTNQNSSDGHELKHYLFSFEFYTLNV